MGSLFSCRPFNIQKIIFSYFNTLHFIHSKCLVVHSSQCDRKVITLFLALLINMYWVLSHDDNDIWRERRFDKDPLCFSVRVCIHLKMKEGISSCSLHLILSRCLTDSNKVIPILYLSFTFSPPSLLKVKLLLTTDNNLRVPTPLQFYQKNHFKWKWHRNIIDVLYATVAKSSRSFLKFSFKNSFETIFKIFKKIVDKWMKFY